MNFSELDSKVWKGWRQLGKIIMVNVNQVLIPGIFLTN